MRRASFLVLLGVELLAAVVLAVPASAGVVTEHCVFDHEANDDPIVHPADPGGAHLHEFFGAPGIDAFTTPASLLAAGAGGCDIAGDLSGYWHPAIYVDGAKIPIGHVGPYWRDLGGVVEAPPFGTELVAGGWGTNVTFQCTPGGTASLTPPDCTGRGVVKLLVTFPSCWDGAGTAQADFAYRAGRVCPSGFAHPIPTLSLHVVTKIVDATGQTWTCALSPDGTTGPIETFHADWMDAFTPEAMGAIVTRLNG